MEELLRYHLVVLVDQQSGRKTTDSPTHSIQLKDSSFAFFYFVSIEITFVAMSALIPLLANASVAFFGGPNLTKCIFLTARVTVAMILKDEMAG